MVSKVREGKSVEEERGLPPNPRIEGEGPVDIEGNVVVEIRLHRRADHRGGEQRQRKQQTMKPIPFARAEFGKCVRLSRTGFGIQRIRRRREILGGHNKPAAWRLLQRL
jgi:hypothetical protein